MQKIRKGDKVVVLAGKDKGKEGEIASVDPKSGKAVVDGINILPEGGMHSSHLHPHSVISGTTYVAMPGGTSALKLEDPRHARMMAAPARVRARGSSSKNR